MRIANPEIDNPGIANPRIANPWYKLDNAAKFFPPTTSRRNTHVFRVACELAETVDPDRLQDALEKTLRQLPYFRSSLKKGFFWYYLEENAAEIHAAPETLPPCAAFHTGDDQAPLFRLTYYRNRVSMDVYHALTDGKGAFVFFCELLIQYLTKNQSLSVPAASARDDFDANYAPGHKRRGVHGERAYLVRGEKYPDYRLGFITGRMPLKAVLDKAREKDASLSEYLAALLIASIGDVMPAYKKKRTVVVSMPVDLRPFYSSVTVRNFFNTISVSHNFSRGGEAFEDVLCSVKQCFQNRLEPGKIDGQMNQFSSLEHNPLAKAAPLFLKNPALRIAGRITEGGDTAGFSNLGKVEMPPEAAGHIRCFDVLIGAPRPQVSLCSYGDILSVAFSSPFINTDIQCAFYRALASLGMQVDIYSNMPDIQEI